MAKTIAAELLVKTLQQAGIQRIYGITGDSANFITDAIHRSEIRFVHMRHEESAAFAAAAEASATGCLTVCIGSCGPGSLHLINGLYEAHRNGAPVLAIATEIHRSEIGTGYVQEIDTHSVFRGCSHFCEYVREAEQLPRLMGIAMQTAISRGGVAVLIITAEVSTEKIEDTDINYLPIYPQPVIRPSVHEIDAIAECINKVSKVAIFGGMGCRNGAIQVKELAAKIKAPVVWSYRAKEVLDYDNLYPAGMTGLIGTSAGKYALANADLVLLLGCGFAFDTMYPEVPVIQIDIHGENLARRHNIIIGAVGDIGATLDELLPLINEKIDDTYARKCLEKYAKAKNSLGKLAEQPLDSKHKIYPEHLTSVLNKKIASNAWITADMGTPWAFAGRYLESLGGRRFFTSSLHGTMAAALPFSIGLSMTDRSRQVIALCGDGGLSMLMGELLTLIQEKVSPKIFVYNNSSLDFVAMEMKADGLLSSYTNLVNPNFADIAKVIGIKGIRVENVAELEGAVDEAMQYDGAVLVDVVVDPNSLLIPPEVTASMIGKYSHYAFKMLYEGDVEELLEEAVTNLRKR